MHYVIATNSTVYLHSLIYKQIVNYILFNWRVYAICNYYYYLKKNTVFNFNYHREFMDEIFVALNFTILPIDPGVGQKINILWWRTLCVTTELLNAVLNGAQ